MKKLIVLLVLVFASLTSFSQYSWDGDILTMQVKNGYNNTQYISFMVFDKDSILMTPQYKQWLMMRSSDAEYMEENGEKNVFYLFLKDILAMGLECIQDQIDNPVTVQFDIEEGDVFVYTKDGITDIVVSYYVKYKNAYDRYEYKHVYSTVYMDGDAATHRCSIIN